MESIKKLTEENAVIKETLEVINENVAKDIHTAVRRATTQLKT